MKQNRNKSSIEIYLWPNEIDLIDRCLGALNSGRKTIRKGGDGRYSRSSWVAELIRLEAARMMRDGILEAPRPEPGESSP